MAFTKTPMKTGSNPPANTGRTAMPEDDVKNPAVDPGNASTLAADDRKIPDGPDGTSRGSRGSKPR